MKALQFRVGSWLRSRRRSVVLLTIVVAAIATILLTVAAGAHRTSTAPDRYTAAHSDRPGATAQQETGRPRTAEVAALPGAASVEAASFIYGGIRDPDSGEFFDSIAFSGSYLAAGDRLVAGRAPDPTRPNEFVASENLAEASGLSIGDTVQLVTLTQADADEFGLDPAHAHGPVIDGVLVGLFTTAADLDDFSALAVFSPALIEDEEIGIASTVMAIWLDDGVSVEDFGAQLDTLPAAEQITYEAAAIVSSETRTAVRGQAIGLWLLTGLGAVAAVAALGQVLTRTARLDADEVRNLGSLGYSRAQMLGETIGRAAVPVFAGITVAVGGAIAVSGLFPFGFVRRVEPDPGVRFEALTMLVGWLMLIAVLLGSVGLAGRVRRREVASRRPAAIDAVAARCPSPTMATGLRFAFGSRGRGPSTAISVAGAVFVVAALVGTMTFAVSTRRLVEEPARYGSNFDFVTDSGAEEVPPELLEILETDRDVDAVTLYTASQARVAGSTIAVVGIDRVRGDLGPVLLAGRLPATTREAVIGRRSARELHLSVGDEISLSNASGTAAYVITGLVVPPVLRSNDIIGRGAMLTQQGLARLEPTAVPNAVAVELRAGLPPGSAARIATEAGIPVSEDSPSRPPSIVNVARITFVPFALAGLLAALGALVVANVLYTGVRRRDSQVAVLRSLGADRRWLVRTVCWQATASTLVPALIGAPIGFVAGRLAFTAFADHLATVNDTMLPLGLSAAAVAALVVLGIGVAMLAGRPARRAVPATFLRAD